MKHFFNTLDKRKVFLLSFFMAFLCLLPFLIRDGFFFLYYGDYNMQQLPFYTLVHRAVRNGELFLNLTTDLGSSIYSSYSFYLLGSPFFWITIPFPEAALPYLMPFLLMLKLGLSSVTAFHYLKRHTTDTRSACIGALLYTFSGFQTMNLVFNHFLDVAVFFPLYLVCLEQLAEEGKRLRFAFCTALMAVINYYFFFGEVVFLILYTLIKYTLPLKKQLKVLISISKRTCASLFYKCLNLLNGQTIPEHGDFRLMSRRVIEELSDFQEVNLFLRGMIPMVGFSSTAIYYERKERFAGNTHYPLRRQLSLAANGITSLSIRPLHMIAGFGFLMAFFSFIGILWSVIQYFRGLTVWGWASTTCIICLVSGIQLICLGVLGEYIGKIYLEVKHRPRYIIDSRTEHTEENNE